MEEVHKQPGSGWFRNQGSASILLIVAALLVAIALAVRPINHDEGQYVAAIALARHGLAYRDFAYLQTPLQPLVLAPLGLLPAGWLLVAARVVNALLGLVTIMLLVGAVGGRASTKATLIAVAACCCSEPFLLASSLARNDALPMALLAAAILALLRALKGEGRPLLIGAAGLLLGLAASAKINAALPAAAAGLFLALRAGTYGWRPLAAFVLGGLIGLLPTLVLAAIAPAQFRFDVFTYGFDAPIQWWVAVGGEQWLKPGIRLLHLLAIAVQGCVFAGVVAAAIDRRRSDERLLLDLMIIAGLVAAYLPQPAYVQYLVPLLPPVVVRLSLAIDSLRGRSRAVVTYLVLACSVIGLFRTGHYLVATVRGGDDLLRALRQGREVARIAGGRSIVTLSPERVAGSDTNLERGFVTGPFLFRTSDQLGNEAMLSGYSPNWQRIDAFLDERPPAVIVTGAETEAHPPLFKRGLDEPLVAWARARAYSSAALPGGLIIWRRRDAGRGNWSGTSDSRLAGSAQKSPFSAKLAEKDRKAAAADR